MVRRKDYEGTTRNGAGFKKCSYNKLTLSAREKDLDVVGQVIYATKTGFAERMLGEEGL
ncbi:MAG: hypothetical protein HPY68_10560 [Candidatus Atribacteria bacterium]|nr:hypothetical protein [Candidatus Atribacteria bacterium]